MDQLLCAFLSHTHYWYDVGMLKIPGTKLKVLCAENSSLRLGGSSTRAEFIAMPNGNFVLSKAHA